MARLRSSAQSIAATCISCLQSEANQLNVINKYQQWDYEEQWVKNTQY